MEKVCITDGIDTFFPSIYLPMATNGSLPQFYLKMPNGLRYKFLFGRYIFVRQELMYTDLLFHLDLSDLPTRYVE